MFLQARKWSKRKVFNRWSLTNVNLVRFCTSCKTKQQEAQDKGALPKAIHCHLIFTVKSTLLEAERFLKRRILFIYRYRWHADTRSYLLTAIYTFFVLPRTGFLLSVSCPFWASSFGSGGGRPISDSLLALWQRYLLRGQLWSHRSNSSSLRLLLP